MTFLTRMCSMMMRNSLPMVQNTGDRAPLMFCRNAVMKCVMIDFLPFNSNLTYILWPSAGTTTAASTITSVSVDTYPTTSICRVDLPSFKSRLGTS